MCLMLRYCPGGPDSDFEYSTQSYTGYEVSLKYFCTQSVIHLSVHLNQSFSIKRDWLFISSEEISERSNKCELILNITAVFWFLLY